MERTAVLLQNKTLLAECVKEFSAKPFEFASLNDIIKNSGYNKGSFYYRFEDKFQFYITLMELVNIDILSIFNSLLLQVKTPYTSQDIVYILLKSFYQLKLSNHDYLLIIQHFYRSNESFQEKVLFLIPGMILEKVYSILDINDPMDPTKVFIQTIIVSSSSISSMSSIEMFMKSFSAFPSIKTNIEFTNQTNFTVEEISIDSFINTLEPKKHIAIFGHRQSGKTTFSLQLFQKLSSTHNVAYITQDNQMFYDKEKGRIKLSRLLKKFQKDTKMSLIEAKKLYELFHLKNQVPITGLNPSFVRNFCSILYATPEIMIIDDIYTGSNLLLDHLIYDSLLKFKSRLGTIVSINKHYPFSLQDLDYIGFFSNYKLLSLYAYSDLITKYHESAYTIEFIEFNRVNTIIVTQDFLQSESFTSFAKNHPIHRIYLTISDEKTLYKLETGVEL
ncbi:MAG: AAA family ATPase [bacterium]|nr:AAA family ATPase [bacterium]